MEWLGSVATHPITLVSVGSAIGGNMRYFLNRWIKSYEWTAEWPWGTFIINVTGSMLLGFLAMWFLEKMDKESRELYLFFGTGFCGGYTTFSAFEWELFALIRQENWTGAMAYAFGSLLIGFVGVLGGAGLAMAIFGKRGI